MISILRVTILTNSSVYKLVGRLGTVSESETLEVLGPLTLYGCLSVQARNFINYAALVSKLSMVRIGSVYALPFMLND